MMQQQKQPTPIRTSMPVVGHLSKAQGIALSIAMWIAVGLIIAIGLLFLAWLALHVLLAIVAMLQHLG